MKKKLFRFEVKFTVRKAGDPGFQLAGFLDMMRYDQATVLKWDRVGNDFIVTLESTSFTLERWQSFGLYPKEVL